MNLSSLSINRPIMATVFGIVIVLFGVVGFSYLGVREFPSVDPPIVTIRTDYTGANADIIESQITEPLEEAISAVEGINTIKSTSSDGRSSISIEFNLEMDMEAAANDVRDKVSRAIRNLPPDADPPVVVKSDADAETIMSITVSSKERNLLELTDIGLNTFKERLQTIPGISEIRIWGDKSYAMRLELDPGKMAAFGLSPLEVRQALDRENVELPSGILEGKTTELTIRTFGRLNTEQQFENLIIKEFDDQIIRLKDIGIARLGAQNERSILRGNGGVPMIGVAISPRPGANYVAISDEVYKRIGQIKKQLPPDINLGVALDVTTSIRKSISEVQETIFLAFGLVILIIFLFLRDWRTTLIPAVAIPISLIGAFFIMYLSDFSINILTLLGIVLSTGLVVDDAIVVMENIYSKIERGVQPKEAAHQGSKEIYFAVIATTIVLTAVFLPIIFLQGLTGRLFREFGVVVAGSVIISSFVSLSLTPVLSSKLLKRRKNRSALYKKSEVFFKRMTEGYNLTLHRFLHHKAWAFVFMGACIAVIFLIGSQLQSELAPMEDKSRLRMFATAPEGTTFDHMNDYMTELIELTDTMKEKESLLSVTSPGFGSSININTGFVRLTLVPPDKREKSQAQIAQELTQKVKDYNFAQVFVSQEQTIGGGGFRSLPVEFVVQGSDIESLRKIIPGFLEEARKSPKFNYVDVDLKFTKPELQVKINRDKARQMGISVRDIAETLQFYYSGLRFGYFIKKGKQYYVIGQAKRSDRDDPEDLMAIQIPAAGGKMVALRNLVDLSYQSNPPQLFRYNRYASVTFSAVPAEGLTVGDGIEEMDRIANLHLNEEYTTSLAGSSKEFAESGSSLLFAFLLALVLVYLSLAAQFESFRDPLVVMFTVPLALAGAVLSLWLFGHTLNIFSQIGIIMLVGLVTKNGILMVEFANQLKEKGMTKFEAIHEASTQRLRPILMTSMATILGALPIAMALGNASTSRIPMGIVIVGGLLFSLLLTLYIIPALYLYVSPKKRPTQ